MSWREKQHDCCCGLDSPAQNTSGKPYPAQALWHGLISTIALRTSQALELAEILQATADGVRQLLECDRVLLLQFYPDWSGRAAVESVAAARWSLLNRVIKDPCFEASWLESCREKRFFAIEDIDAAGLTPCHAQFLSQFHIRANLIIPVWVKEQLWGLMVAHSCTASRQWQSTDVEGLQQVVLQIGIAIHQAQLVAELRAAKTQLEAKGQQAYGQLQQSQNQLFQLAAIVGSSQDVIISETLDGIITSWNAAAEHLFGYSAEEMLGKPISILIPPERQAEADEVLKRIGQGQPANIYETQRLRKDGQLLDIALTISPVHDQNGQVIGASKIARDITERKRDERLRQAAERALLESQNRFQAFMTHAPILTWLVGVDGIISFANPAWLKFMGHTAESVIGRSHNELFPEKFAQEYERNNQQVIHTGEVLETLEQALSSKGKVHTFLVRKFPVYQDQQIAWVGGIAVDITQQNQIETALKNTKDQLELFIQATSEGFWDWDFTTGDIYFSPRWKEMLGYDDHELENSLEAWRSVIFKEDQTACLQLIEDYNSGVVDSFTATQRFRHKNGSTVHLLSRAIHLKDEQGKVVRMVGSYLDMTPMVEMQAALKTSETQLSSILDSSLDGIMAFRSVRNDQGKIVDFQWLLSNPTACEMVSRPSDQLINNRLLQVMPGNRDEGLFDQYMRVVESGEPLQRQLYYNRDGVDCWFENVAVKLGDGFVVTFRNITQVKQSERALQKANQQLEKHLEDLQQRNQEMLLLSETSDFLQACLSLEEACAVITSLVEPLFPKCSGGIFITSASRNRVEKVAAWGAHLHSHTDFGPHDCWSLRRGRPHWVGQGRQGLLCNHVHDRAEVVDTLCIPMIAQGETLGLFYLNAETPGMLPETKQQLARTVAEQVALAIANLHLRETLQHQSIRDPLTGLFNRRYLEETLQQELSRAQRHQQPIGVIMIDVDHFKRFNDTYGHDTGDYVLQAVGKLIQESVRGSDVACRYGGEEIILVLPEASLAGTQTRAEDLRRAICQLKVAQGGRLLDSLTASFGVACFPQHGATGEALIQAADAALYRAKAAGRNQVIAAS